MKQDAPSLDFLKSLTEFSDLDLRTYAWTSSLLMQGMEPCDRSRFLGTLLGRALEGSIVTRDCVLDHLLDHIEEMSPQDQVRFIEAYASLAESGTKQNRDIWNIFGRLSRRVTPDVKNLLLAFVRSYPPSAEEQSEYREACVRISTDDSSESPVVNHDSGAVLTCNHRRFGHSELSRTTQRERPTVALIVPEFLSANSFLQAPVDMLMAAARLQKEGYHVVFVDNRIETLSLENLAKRVESADVIAVTTSPYDHIQTYFLDYRLRYSFKAITVLKRRNPDATVVVCGAHGTVRPDIVLRDTAADIILRGEYDYTMVPLVKAIVGREGFDNMPYVLSRESESDKRQAQYTLADYTHTEPVFDLNDSVLPAYDLIDFQRYFGDVYNHEQKQWQKQWRWGTILATRGCAHECTFCFNFWGRRVRYRDPQSVVEEMEYLHKEHHVNDIFFIDFHFTQSPTWVTTFCDLVRRRSLNMRWSAQTRTDTVTRSLLEQMRSANCQQLWFGVESFAGCILQNVKKYKDAEVTSETLTACRDVGIKPYLFIVIGMPGETRTSINTTLRTIHTLDLPYTQQVMVATPRFGTPYYTMAKQQFPRLGNDFYSLAGVRGITANELSPVDLEEAISVFSHPRFFLERDAPQLPV